MHKALKEGEIAPVRPIVICNRTVMENPRKLVTFHLKEVSTVHPIYIKDTPDFIRKVEDVNDNSSLTNAMQKMLNRGLHFAVLPKKLDFTNFLWI